MLVLGIGSGCWRLSNVYCERSTVRLPSPPVTLKLPSKARSAANQNPAAGCAPGGGGGGGDCGDSLSPLKYSPRRLSLGSAAWSTHDWRHGQEKVSPGDDDDVG